MCLDVPWPADYGGAMEMMNKIEALFKAGIKIHLHYYLYNHRGNPNELNRYCETIDIYERKKITNGFSFSLPYIVASRINEKLIGNLLKDNYPILLEGVHCTGILPELDLSKRKIVVRLHNDEGDYYKSLERSTNHLLKKLFFHHESRMLKKYEMLLPSQLPYACITEFETEHYRNEHKLKNAFYLPAFTPYNEVNGKNGLGNFCFYHGNLSVPENEKAAIWLLTKVFSKIKIPFVIAGKKPSRRLEKMAHLYQHTCLVADPSDAEINDLVKKAHINILPSFSTTGIKMKLLHALFEGRHCVVNENMVTGSGLESACHIGNNADAFASIIMQLHHHPFEDNEIHLRKNLLEKIYNNEKNAEQLIAYLW